MVLKRMLERILYSRTPEKEAERETGPEEAEVAISVIYPGITGKRTDEFKLILGTNYIALGKNKSGKELVIKDYPPWLAPHEIYQEVYYRKNPEKLLYTFIGTACEDCETSENYCTGDYHVRIRYYRDVNRVIIENISLDKKTYVMAFKNYNGRIETINLASDYLVDAFFGTYLDLKPRENVILLISGVRDKETNEPVPVKIERLK